MANEHRKVTWSEGVIAFGGREFSFQAGDTYAALPVGIGTWLTQGERYILFWESGASEQLLQTLPESTYVHDSKNRVIVGEITCATTASGDFVDGIAAQFDVKVDGLSSSLTSDSFSDTIAFLSREGTAAIPAHSFVGRTDAGMYSGAADQVHFSTAGVERLEITNTGITVAGTADATAYTIGGIALNEYIADTVGTMITSNTETRISVTYDDSDNTLDFVVDDMSTATNVTVSANNTTDETVYPIFVDGSTGAQGIETDTGLTYNPSTGVLTGTTFAISPPTNDGNLPDASYGTLRWHEDGGEGSTDTLGFLSGQTFGGRTGLTDGAKTPTTTNHGSSFYSMLSEIDTSARAVDGSGYVISRLIFEPIIDYSYYDNNSESDTNDGYYNYPYLGYHNWIYSLNCYYGNFGAGSAAVPGITLGSDNNTGFYNIASGHTGYSDDGTLRVNFGSHSFSPSGDDTHTLEFSVQGSGGFNTYVYSAGCRPTDDDEKDLGSGSYRWDDVHATNGTIVTSDIRLKENIQPMTLGLDFINDLNPVTYKWIKKKENKRDQTHYGIIAQEVLETLKKHGIDSIDDFGGVHWDGETYYGARYTEFVPILMKAVQELSAEIKELKEKN